MRFWRAAHLKVLAHGHHAHGHEPGVHRARGHGQAVAFAVVKEMALVTLQDGFGDFHRLREAAFQRPFDEVAQIRAAVVHGARAEVLHAHPLAEGFGERVPAVRIARVADGRARGVCSFLRHTLRLRWLRFARTARL
jgi:ribosomal protein S12 methylthiotransferase accessory factor YcaO